MKVLDDKAKVWVYALMCPHCKSDLVIDASDVYQKTSTSTESTSTYYSVECGACTREIDMNKRGIPEWVLFTSKEKAAHKKSKEQPKPQPQPLTPPSDFFDGLHPSEAAYDRAIATAVSARACPTFNEALFSGPFTIGGAIIDGVSGDRGCVSCGQLAKAPKIYIVDVRDRYWCLDCARDALANVRRRVDERTDYVYPWIFPRKPSELKHGPNGLGGPGPCDINCEKCAAEARLKAPQVRQPELSYINLGKGMAKVTCTCGWEEAPMPVSPFDPAEALVGASSAHPRCKE